MATCPKCLKRYSDDATACAEDGEGLVADATFAGLDRDIPAGEMIGEYRVEDRLGSGGFGTVYRATHPVIGKAAAIKVLNRQLSSAPEMVSRFVAEARAANQIRSRHIIDIFAFGALDDGRQYFVMELLDGMTLEDHLKAKGRLSPGETVTLLKGIAKALDAAHNAGIVHRDLKPENIFLVREEDAEITPKLLDFGIAKLIGDPAGTHRTRTGVPMGTPYYMSPEQCRGDKIDHRTDIYSLGVVTHQLLTGRLPLTADSFMQVMMKHITAEPPRVSEICPELPPALDACVLAMLAKDPDARPSSAGAAVQLVTAAAQAAGFPVETTSLERSAPGGGSGLTPAQIAHFGTAPTLAGASTPNAAAAAATSSRRLLLALVGVVAVATVVIGVLVATRGGSPPQAVASAEASAPPTAVPATPPSASLAVQPAVSASAAPPARVSVDVQSDPDSVEVFLGDELLGTVPKDRIELPRSEDEVELLVKAKGYKDATLKVTPSRDTVVSVKLVPERRAVAPVKRPPKTGKSELEF